MARSVFSQLLPLIIAIIIISAIAWVGYQIYQSVCQIGATASEHMGKKNVVFTKDGARVGVKYVENENYVSNTQRWVVKAWNLGTAPKEEEEAAKQKKKWF